MAQQVNGNNLLLGRGKIYFDRFNSSGVKTGERFLGNCSTFEVTPTVEDIKKYSSADRAAGLIASDVLRTTLALRIVGDEFSKENLAAALFGDNSTLSQTTGAVTGEVIAGVIQGCYYALANRKVSSVSVTDGATPTPHTYVATTDYVVDAETGRIYIVEGGGIASASSITVAYTRGNVTMPTIRGMNQTSVKGFLRFVGEPARGPRYEVQIWRAALRADGAIGFISDDYASFTLTGDVESDGNAHPNNPHFLMLDLNNDTGAAI